MTESIITCTTNNEQVIEEPKYDDHYHKRIVNDIDIESVNKFYKFPKLERCCKTYQYWIQHFIIIGSCICTIIGAAKHAIQNHPYNVYDQWGDVVKYVIPPGYTMSLAICGIAGGTVVFVIITMIMDKCKKIAKYTTYFIPHDNRFRLICICKTGLLVIKQVLIMQISQWIWTTVYSVLSVISLCTLAYHLRNCWRFCKTSKIRKYAECQRKKIIGIDHKCIIL